MKALMLPGRVSADSAEVWLGLVDDLDASGLDLSLGATAVKPSSGWLEWKPFGETPRLRYQRITFTGLTARTTYPIRLTVSGGPAVEGQITTLPGTLPTLAERPFTVLLASCFYASADPAGMVGRTFMSSVTQGARPDVKILCGDQVYLDAPWQRFLRYTHTPGQLAAEFLARYLNTWTHRGAGAGFFDLLRLGANYFTSDDHDFWNNAPSRALHVRDTWTGASREAWLRLARDLFVAFQSPRPVERFQVGGLSFMIADTRINRDPAERQFMNSADLHEVINWIEGLSGPGVLVTGQSLFAEQSGRWGHLFDWGLPDYGQYAELVNALTKTRHSVVVATGDVHFGRVASCRLVSGRELVEVISSPMALVDAKARGKRKPAPGRFPASAVPAVVQRPTTTDETPAFEGVTDHFTTLEFSAVGAAVRVQVRIWPIPATGAATSPRLAARRDLH